MSVIGSTKGPVTIVWLEHQGLHYINTDIDALKFFITSKMCFTNFDLI